MASRLHKPVSDVYGASGDAAFGDQSRNDVPPAYQDPGYGNGHARAPPPFTERSREMPFPYSEGDGHQGNGSPDPRLAATVDNLFEDNAPTDHRRSWNGAHRDGDYPHNRRHRATSLQNPRHYSNNQHTSNSNGFVEPAGPSAAGNLGRQSQTVECPWCHTVVTTTVRKQIGVKAGGAAVAAAIIAWPLFWVPLVIPALQRKTHYCPQCNRKIGRGRRNV
ncbi:hypothetical protein GQ54DRAFT_308802 [Martensiomyces pterosporus]|nr:hypothetical protein GQ54DRAFT_308802 [Martensiomyces pterosporus]